MKFRSLKKTPAVVTAVAAAICFALLSPVGGAKANASGTGSNFTNSGTTATGGTMTEDPNADPNVDPNADPNADPLREYQDCVTDKGLSDSDPEAFYTVLSRYGYAEKEDFRLKTDGDMKYLRYIARDGSFYAEICPNTKGEIVYFTVQADGSLDDLTPFFRSLATISYRGEDGNAVDSFFKTFGNKRGFQTAGTVGDAAMGVYDYKGDKSAYMFSLCVKDW